MMRVATLIVLTVAVSACTSLRQTVEAPEELRSLIVQERLVRPGDRVRLTVADSSSYEFRVQRVDITGGDVVGKNIKVPIADIVEVEMREVSVLRTAALVVGVVGGIQLAIGVGSAPAAILGAGM